jgi:hypothetical protein
VPLYDTIVSAGQAARRLSLSIARKDTDTMVLRGWLLLVFATLVAQAQVQPVPLPGTGRVVAHVFSRDPLDASEGLQVAYLIGRGTTATASILKCELSESGPTCGASLSLAGGAAVSDMSPGYAHFPHMLGGTSTYGVFAQRQSFSNELQLINVQLNFATGPTGAMTKARLTVVDSNGGMPIASARNTANERVSYLGTDQGKVYAISYPTDANSAPGFTLLSSPSSNPVLGMAFLPSASPSTPGDGTLFLSLFAVQTLYALPVTGSGVTAGTLSTPSFASNGILTSFVSSNRLYMSNSETGYEISTSGSQVSTWPMVVGGSRHCQAITPPMQGLNQPVVFSGVSPSGVLKILTRNFTTGTTSSIINAVSGSGLECSNAFIANVVANKSPTVFFAAIANSSPGSSTPRLYAVALDTLTACTVGGTCSTPTPTRSGTPTPIRFYLP